jgi:hypothetical protein
MLSIQAFVLSVVPLHEIRVDDGVVAEAARSQVSRARCSGLVRTSSNASWPSTGRICSARRRPFAVNRMSVAPVCGPLRLHSLSPCRMAKTRCSELPMSLKIQGSVFPA